MDTTASHALTFDHSHHFDDDCDRIIKSAIFSFLNDSTKSAHDLVQMINQEFKLGEHDPGGFLDETVDTFIFMSKFIPAEHSAQDRLLELVKAMGGLPDRVCYPRWSEFMNWHGDMNIVEAFYGGLELECRLDDPNNDAGRIKWRNFNAFLARLTRDIESCNLSWRAILVFQDALETQEPDPVRFVMDLSIVLDWLSLAGRKLRQSKSTNWKGGLLWDGEPGFSRTRWLFWRDRLGDILQGLILDEQMKDKARRGVQIMEYLEEK